MQVVLQKVQASNEFNARRGAEFRINQLHPNSLPTVIGLKPIYRPRPTRLPHVYLWLVVVEVH